MPPVASHHLVIGGQRSGKSRHAERLGLAWLASGPGRRVVVIATAVAGDDEEMRCRIDRHRADRPAPFETLEAPLHLDEALRAAAGPDTLVLVDCLTLWLTNVLMGAAHGQGIGSPSTANPGEWDTLRERMLAALEDAPGPMVLVSNEIGLGVIPLGEGVRQFVDELGRLNQAVAQRCSHMTWMVAGQPWTREVQRWD